MQSQIQAHRSLEQTTPQPLLSLEEIKTLRKYKTIVDSSIHPDTGDLIPPLMRMCAFVPTNLPIIFGMLMTTPTPLNTVFFQWLN